MSIIYSAHEAKARFAEMLRRVRSGETVTVSYHGEAVAEVRPLPQGNPAPQTNDAQSSDAPIGPNARAMTVVAQLAAKADKSKSEEERFEDMRRRGILYPSSQPDRPLEPVCTIPGALDRFLAERD